MKNLLKWTCCGIVLGTLTLGAYAEKPEKAKEGKGKRPTPTDRFAKMDADGNGEVTLEEFTSMHEKRMARMKDRPEGARTPPAPEKVFSKMDTNGDGILTQDEIKDRGPREKKMKKEKKEKKERKNKKGDQADEG